MAGRVVSPRSRLTHHRCTRAAWRPLLVCVVGCTALLVSACDDPPAAVGPTPSAAPEPVLTAIPKPEGPPELSIDDLGPKVGWTRVLLEKKEGPAELAKELGEVKEHLSGKDALLKVDRKAKLDWVMAMFAELEKQGVSTIRVATDSRTEFPKELKFIPQGKRKDAKECSLVATVLEDRGTAVWKLSGGAAIKRRKGFAGPDLTTTGETIEQRKATCPDAPDLFLTASEGIEWGLVYDLGASTSVLKKASFDGFVLLLERPVAGRKVDL
ncbi:MAG: hypothetical protein KIT72_18120 [Polyangiaceae bacterium]|nr:hypothetical protein [Polyangiaceae bacterium]MCW5792333.1 hypothetical protein [Polyangiaceae bacterium]